MPAIEQRQLHARLRARAVTVGHDGLDVADLVLLGLHLGWWQQFERGVRRGMALEVLDLRAPSAEEIRSAATHFRYSLALVSAREFKAWLDARRLTVGDLAAVIARGLLRARESAHVVDDDRPLDVAAVLWAEASVGGVLRELAREGADRLVARPDKGDGTGSRGVVDQEAIDALTEVARRGTDSDLGAQLGEHELSERCRRVLELDAALGELRDRVAHEGALRSCLASHALDWLQIGGAELALATEGAAREARLLFLDDEFSLVEAGERAGVEVLPRRLTLDRVTSDAASLLVATGVGELAGPWLEGDRWKLLLVDEKSPPSLAEPELRERATQELLRDLLDRTLAGQVDWPQAL